MTEERGSSQLDRIEQSLAARTERSERVEKTLETTVPRHDLEISSRRKAP